MKRKKSSIWSIAVFFLSFLATLIFFRCLAERKMMQVPPCEYGPPPVDYVEGIGNDEAAEEERE